MATRISFLLKAGENLPDVEVRQSRTRQIKFSDRGRTFEARYDHKIAPQGGVAFVEMLPGQGQPEVLSLPENGAGKRGFGGPMLKIAIEREKDGRWIGTVPTLPGVLAYGATEAEARKKTSALALRVIADRIEHGELVPD